MTRRLELAPRFPEARVAFRCTSCGNCCRDLRVALTHRDVLRLKDATGDACEALVEWLGPNEVDMSASPETLVELDVGRRLLVLAHREGACRFLTAELRCGVYDARPLDCRLFPFDVEPGVPGARVVGLLTLTKCEYADDTRQSVAAIEREDDRRSRELVEYRELVARWNWLARHRRRLKRSVGGAAAFFAYAGLGE